MTIKCCGTIVPTIDITTPRGPLSLACCQRCETRRWFHHGAPVQLSEILAMASADWKNTRAWDNPWRQQRHLAAVS